MRKPAFLHTKYRLVLAGNELRIDAYEKPIFYGFSVGEKVPHYHETEEDSRPRARNRAVKRVRNLVDANFMMWIDQFGRPAVSKFWTLTFRDEFLLPEEANREFKLFVKRLNYTIFKTKKSVIQYLAVIEFQPESKKVHYHIMIFNLSYVDKLYNVINEQWGLGFVWLRTVPDRNIGQYVTKYMTKEDDEKLRGQPCYLRSRGLIEPTIILNEVFIALLLRSLPDDALTYANAYVSEHTGVTELKRFSLEKYPKIRDYILAHNPESATFKKPNA